jgi:dUTP pyrophosphatase
MNKKLLVDKLSRTAILPTRAYDKALAYDLYADKIEENPCHFGTIIKVHTGIAIQFPDGFGGLIRDRSSMAFNGYSVVGGVIDEDYRGEITVVLKKDSWMENPKKGDKVAQLLLIPTPKAKVEESSLTETKRGKKGFGSTGK